MQAEQTDSGTEITDEAITQYLNCNPDFFVNNQDILSRLRIPHDSGKAVSLIEKQVGVLRSKSRHLENSLLDLIAVARQNENLHDRLHTLIQEIITAPTLSDIVALTQTSLRDNFSAEDVHILLIAAAPKRASRKKSGKSGDKSDTKSAPEKSSTSNRAVKLTQVEGATVVRHSDRRIKHFAEVFAGKQTVCGMPETEQLNAMIGKDHAHVASAAIIPLHYERKLGLVMLTSRDESRFGVNKGVMFLNQMGELLSRRIHSYDAHARSMAK